MTGSGMITLKKGLKQGMLNIGGMAQKVEMGRGVPNHAGPDQAIYVNLGATLGTSSHYRKDAGVWTPMSDD